MERYWANLGWGKGKYTMRAAAQAGVPWLGVFVVPTVFSKLHATNELQDHGVGSQYPAIFYLPAEVHEEMAAKLDAHTGTCVKNESFTSLRDYPIQRGNPTSAWEYGEHHILMSSNEVREADKPYCDRLIDDDNKKEASPSDDRSKQLLEHYKRTHHLPPGSKLLEVCSAEQALAKGIVVVMICLKIQVAGSMPWWINLQHVRLIRPASCL